MAGRQVLSAAVRGGVRKQTTAANTATTFSSSLEPSVFDEFTTSVRISETEKSVRSRTAKTVKLNWEGVKLFHPLPEGTSKSKWKFPHGNLSQLSFQAALKIWPPSSSPTPSSSSSSSTPISRKKKKEAISSTTTSPILTPSENRARLLSMSLEEVEKSLVTLCSEMTTEFVTQSKKSKTTTVSSSSSSSSTTKEEVLAGAEWVARNLSACTSFPWEDIVASPFSLRLQALAVESGLYAVNHEFRGYPAEKSLAEQGSKSNRGQLSGAAPSLVTTSTDFSKPKWKRGQLIVPSFETHRRGRERPLMVLHPQLMAKQSSLEAAAAISGPFWHKNVTNWELYMATRAAKTLEASTFYFIDDVLRTRDPNLLPWFRGTPLGGIYAEEGKRIAQEKVGTRYPSRDFLLEGQVTTKDAGEGGGVVKERISFKQPSGLFPRWVDVESLKQKDYSDWLRQQAKLLQDGVRVFDREIKALREQISLQEPFPSLYHPECPNLAVSEEAFDFLLHHANRFVGNPLYSLAINHVIPRPPLPASSSALTSPSSYIPCSTLNEYLDHLENFVDRLLFQPIQVRSDQFFARAKARTLADYLAQVSLVPLPVSDSESPALLERLHEDAGAEIKRAFEDSGFVIDLKKWRLAIPNMAGSSNQSRLAFATGARKFVDQGWDSWCDLFQLFEGLKASLPITTHTLSALLWTPGVHRFPEFLEGIINSEVMAWSRMSLSQRIITVLSQLKLVISGPSSTSRNSSTTSEFDSAGLRQILVDLANFEQLYREANATHDEFTPLLREVGGLSHIHLKNNRRKAMETEEGKAEEGGHNNDESRKEVLLGILSNCRLALNPVFQVRWFASDVLTLFSAVEEQWLRGSRLSKSFTLKERQDILKFIHLVNSTRVLKEDTPVVTQIPSEEEEEDVVNKKMKMKKKGKKEQIVDKHHATTTQQHRGFHFLFGSGTILPVPDFLASNWPQDRNQPLQWCSFQEMKTLLQPPASEELKALLLHNVVRSPPRKTRGRKRKEESTNKSTEVSEAILSEALEDTDLWWLNLIDTGAVLVVRNRD